MDAAVVTRSVFPGFQGESSRLPLRALCTGALRGSDSPDDANPVGHYSLPVTVLYITV